MAGLKWNEKEITKLVGQRIRLGRQSTSHTLTSLGTELGCTYQQMQKYEKGTNRISAARLCFVAEALDRPINFFYEDICPSGFPELDDSCLKAAYQLNKMPDKELQQLFIQLINKASLAS